MTSSLWRKPLFLARTGMLPAPVAFLRAVSDISPPVRNRKHRGEPGDRERCRREYRQAGDVPPGLRDSGAAEGRTRNPEIVLRRFNYIEIPGSRCAAPRNDGHASSVFRDGFVREVEKRFGKRKLQHDLAVVVGDLEDRSQQRALR